MTNQLIKPNSNKKKEGFYERFFLLRKQKI